LITDCRLNYGSQGNEGELMAINMAINISKMESLLKISGSKPLYLILTEQRDSVTGCPHQER
jgi:hypothetical protein